MVSPLKAVSPPITPMDTAPAPESIVSALLPSTIPSVMSPSELALFVSIVMLAPRVEAPVIVTLPSIVILLSRVIASAVYDNPVKAVDPPITPVSIVPEPAVNEILVVPSIVPVVIFPAPLVPVFNSTCPVAIVRGSVIVIFPPEPALAPAPAPPEVEINVSLSVSVVVAVLRVTAPPAPPAPLVLPALPKLVISAPVEIVNVPAFLASIVTSPPALPAPLEVTVPPDAVMSPPIIIFPDVLPLPGFLTAELISTSPPAISFPPVVSIVEVECEVNDPAPTPKFSPTAIPSS